MTHHPANIRVWEYVNATDHLLEHVLRHDGTTTLCGLVVGQRGEWHADHERPDAVVPCTTCHRILARQR